MFCNIYIFERKLYEAVTVSSSSSIDRWKLSTIEVKGLIILTANRCYVEQKENY